MRTLQNDLLWAETVVQRLKRQHMEMHEYAGEPEADADTCLLCRDIQGLCTLMGSLASEGLQKAVSREDGARLLEVMQEAFDLCRKFVGNAVSSPQTASPDLGPEKTTRTT